MLARLARLARLGRTCFGAGRRRVGGARVFLRGEEEGGFLEAAGLGEEGDEVFAGVVVVGVEGEGDLEVLDGLGLVVGVG